MPNWLEQIWQVQSSQVQLCQTGQLTNKSKSNVCSKDFTPDIYRLKHCDWRNRVFTKSAGWNEIFWKKPGFWPPWVSPGLTHCDSEKPGFYQICGLKRNILQKTRFLAPVSKSWIDALRLLETGFLPNLRAETKYFGKNPVSGRSRKVRSHSKEALPPFFPCLPLFALQFSSSPFPPRLCQPLQ